MQEKFVCNVKEILLHKIRALHEILIFGLDGINAFPSQVSYRVPDPSRFMGCGCCYVSNTDAIRAFLIATLTVRCICHVTVMCTDRLIVLSTKVSLPR